MQHARETLAAARRTISDLREHSREIPDLKCAIKQEVNRFEKATGISCQLKINDGG